MGKAKARDMAKAFWTIVPAVTVNGFTRPDLPALSSLGFVVPCDINRLAAGAAPADHAHLIVGNVALMSDQAGGGHEHVIAQGGQTIRGGATAHTHPDPGTADFFLVYVRCSDADFTTLLGAPNNVKPVVTVGVTADGQGRPVYGDMDDTPWSAGAANDWQRPAFWAARALAVLGLSLPPAVDRGRRLLLLLLGMLQARRWGDDRPLRG